MRRITDYTPSVRQGSLRSDDAGMYPVLEGSGAGSGNQTHQVTLGLIVAL